MIITHEFYKAKKNKINLFFPLKLYQTWDCFLCHSKILITGFKFTMLKIKIIVYLVPVLNMYMYVSISDLFKKLGS